MEQACRVLDFTAYVQAHSPKTTISTKESYSSEVFPFKKREDVIAMQQYFLDKAQTDRYQGNNTSMRNFLYFVLGINIARRGGDTLNLKWGDILHLADNGQYEVINSEYNRIREQKTGKSAMLVFNKNAVAAIEYYLQATGLQPKASDYVFPSRKGGHIDVGSMRKVIKEAALACGIPFNVGTHSLRKTFGYNLYKSTNDLALVQKVLNHESPIVTLRYIGIDAELIQQAYDQVEDNLIDLSAYSVPKVQGVGTQLRM